MGEQRGKGKREKAKGKGKGATVHLAECVIRSYSKSELCSLLSNAQERVSMAELKAKVGNDG